MAQVVEHLPSKYKALDSTSTTEKKGRKEGRKEGRGKKERKRKQSHVVLLWI
jgi:hypothetical protein